MQLECPMSLCAIRVIGNTILHLLTWKNEKLATSDLVPLKFFGIFNLEISQLVKPHSLRTSAVDQSLKNGSLLGPDF